MCKRSIIILVYRCSSVWCSLVLPNDPHTDVQDSPNVQFPGSILTTSIPTPSENVGKHEPQSSHEQPLHIYHVHLRSHSAIASQSSMWCHNNIIIILFLVTLFDSGYVESEDSCMSKCVIMQLPTV